MESHGSLLFRPTHCSLCCKIEDKKRLFLNEHTILEVIQWPGKRFVPQLTMLLKTYLIIRSISIIFTGLALFQEKPFYWNVESAPRLPDSYMHMSCKCKDVKLSLVWCLYCCLMSWISLYHVLSLCFFWMILLNKMTCWKSHIFLSNITASKKMLA